MIKLTPLLFLICVACSGVKKATQLRAYISQDDSLTRFEKRSQDTLKITYTGCGGFLIEQDSSTILIDPYFSNAGPLSLIFFKEIKTDTATIDGFFQKRLGNNKDIQGMIKSILVAHSHYDHLADLPSVYLRNCNPDSTEIIGSPTTRHILSSTAVEKNALTVIKGASNWLYIKNKRIKILPIPSAHAPHLLGMKLISSKKLTEDVLKFPKKIRKFPEGENYNFLIDFMDVNGKVEFRLFSHAGAACDGDIGIPSDNILAEKEIDVLLLCVANFNQAKNYPEKIIQKTNPKFIIGNHWENFFRPYYKNIRQPAVLPGTNVKKFILRVNKQLDSSGLSDSTKFRLPLPGITISFVN